jgi:hypothetical protein
MKTSFLTIFSFLVIFAKAQYYYQDILGTKETADLIKTYRNNKVSRVLLNSYNAENTKSDDFYVEQVFFYVKPNVENNYPFWSYQ